MSGYSKRQHAESLEKYLVQVIEPYKKYKKAYFVNNNSRRFKGLNIKSHFHYINSLYLMKNMILIRS